MPSYVVTGASRGIGLGFVEQLSKDPENTTFALVRNKETAPGLLELLHSNTNKNIHVIQADISDRDSIKAAAAEVSQATGGKLDVLINNAAKMLYDRSGLTITDFPDAETLENDMTDFFKTNVIGVTHTISTFLPLIQAGPTKKIFVISSGLGDIKYILNAEHTRSPPYCISKAALNMVIAKFAVAVKDVLFLSMTPGWVKTMRGPKEQVDKTYETLTKRWRERDPNFPGAISVEESVRDQLVLFDKVTIEYSGRFVRRDGKDGSLPEFRLEGRDIQL